MDIRYTLSQRGQLLYAILHEVAAAKHAEMILHNVLELITELSHALAGIRFVESRQPVLSLLNIRLRCFSLFHTLT